jgi:DNA replication and repair protein RecF
MACLQRLSAVNVRNLNPVSLEFGPGQNIIFGRNASGKTSLLEAVHILGLAKSFRARHLRQVIQHGAPGMRIHAEIRPGQRPAVALAVEHKDAHTSLHANGVPLTRTSELAQVAPVLLINTDSHHIIVGGPVQRRRMLDWGVFHVEHPHAALLSRYQNTLRQRNLCLHNPRVSWVPAHIWNDELAAAAVAIDQARMRYYAAWSPWITHYVSGLMRRDDIAVAYERGWPVDTDYREVLIQSAAVDRQLGYTRHGPHRATLGITVDGLPAEQCISRGQQKLLVFALAFAQAAALNSARGDRSIVLIDDLAAELDAEHRGLTLHMLAELGGQSLLTVTEPEMLKTDGVPGPRMFHVEHGNVAEVL